MLGVGIHVFLSRLVTQQGVPEPKKMLMPGLVRGLLAPREPLVCIPYIRQY